MKSRVKVVKVKKDRAIELVMNHNCVSRAVAKKYTDAEFKEVLRDLSGSFYKLVTDF